jgi:hypothetical protein
MTDHSIRASTRLPAGGVTAQPVDQKQAKEADQPIVRGGRASTKLPAVAGARVGSAAPVRTPAASPTAPAVTSRVRQSTLHGTQPAAKPLNPAVVQELNATEQDALAELSRLLRETLANIKNDTCHAGDLVKVHDVVEVILTVREAAQAGSTVGVAPRQFLQDEVSHYCASLDPDDVRGLAKGLEKMQAENAEHGDPQVAHKVSEVLSAIRGAVHAHLDSLAAANDRQTAYVIAQQARVEHERRANEGAARDAAAADARHAAIVDRSRRA